MNYKESIISIIIYKTREAIKRMKHLGKKIIKIWKQRKEYFAKYFFAKPKLNGVVTQCLNVRNNQFEIQKESIFETNDFSRLAVYTCVFGNYDQIRNPLVKGKYCDYYIVTDQEMPRNCVWKKISPLEYPEGFEKWHPAIKNRYYKMHPNELFKEYDYSLYLDGNVQPMTDLYPFLLKLIASNKLLALHKHPIFKCLYASGEHLKKLDLVDHETMNNQLRRYSQEGFVKDYGFFECNAILRRHHHEEVIKVMDIWWDEYCKGVKRDQQSFTYALWKNGYKVTDVCILGNNIRENSRVNVVNHKRKHEKVTWSS